MRRGLISAWIAGAVLALVAGCDTSTQDSHRKVAEALTALNAGRTNDGIIALENAIQLDPENARAHYTLGLVRLQELRDPGGALPSLEAACAGADATSEAHYQRGVALQELQRSADARIAFEQAVELDPQHGRALFRLAQITEAAGDIPAAIDLLTRSIWASPRFPMAYNALAAIYTRYGRPMEAVQVLQNALANENSADDEARMGHAQNRADLGRLHLDLGEYDEAVRQLEAASALRPESSSVMFNLAVAYRERYARNGRDDDREQALGRMRRAAQQCNPATEQARCESIAAAIHDLESGTQAP